ncbi:hypothetical protein QE152_g26174 [Popillia japonica]|uniref:Integrase catalytic domain-containing protein n=1 Tax=Popillia japonica TaxID=7064 RepID=A0AAW1JZH7_POPJA
MVLSDNGPPFNGNAIKQFFEAYGIEHKRITPYWPEANGIPESHTNSVAAIARATYSASVEDKAIEDCFFVCQHTVDPKTLNK